MHSITVGNRRNLWGYRGDNAVPFLKITIKELKHYAKVRTAFEKGSIRYKDIFDGEEMVTFESNIAYTLRFMIDHKVRLAPAHPVLHAAD